MAASFGLHSYNSRYLLQEVAQEVAQEVSQEVAQEVLALQEHSSSKKKLNCALSARSLKSYLQ